MQLIKEYVNNKKLELKNFVDSLVVKPTLAIIKVGENPASERYVRNKLKDAEEIGIPTRLYTFEASITESELLTILEKLNKDESITGFIVQLPLPSHINETKVIAAIDPLKDVDGFSKNSLVNPATPQGILDYLISQKVEFTDKNAVVIGRSNIVGKPMAKLLLEQNCNVIQLHSKTSETNKRLLLEMADIIVCATGHRNTITPDYKLKPSCIIMDVGINFNEDNKLCGDIEQELPVAFKSPVPGGCGLCTRLALFTNLLKLYFLKLYKLYF